MANPFDSNFRSPPVRMPTLGTRTDIHEVPIGIRPPLVDFQDSKRREVPIGIRPPLGPPFLGPPLSGPSLTPMQRIAAIFRNAAGNPTLVNQLRRSQNPRMERAIANRGLFRRF